jgi:DNA polymerase III sliding clamp (beta) subunit (PCNA family)
MNASLQLESMPEVLEINKYALDQLLRRVKNAVPRRAGRHSVTSVKFESDGTKIRAVASDGFRIAFAETRAPLTKFPPYQKALSLSNFKTTVTFSAHSLRTALFHLKPAVDRQVPAVTFTVRGSQVRISAGDAETVLAGAKVSGKNNKVKINPAFINDFLSPVSDKLFAGGVSIPTLAEVTMEISNQSTPVRLSNGPEYVHLIMPLLPEARKVKRVP